MPKRHKLATTAAGDASVALAEPGIERAKDHLFTDVEIAERAYSYWEARGYQGGSADEDWLRAVRELSEETQK
jgi:hypothetical protein